MGFSEYVTKVADVGAVYGTFAGAILLVAWIWLTNVAMLFGAELKAEFERNKELREGVPLHDTLDRPRAGVDERFAPRTLIYGVDPAGS